MQLMAISTLSWPAFYWTTSYTTWDHRVYSSRAAYGLQVEEVEDHINVTASRLEVNCIRKAAQQKMAHDKGARLAPPVQLGDVVLQFLTSTTMDAGNCEFDTKWPHHGCHTARWTVLKAPPSTPTSWFGPNFCTSRASGTGSSSCWRRATSDRTHPPTQATPKGNRCRRKGWTQEFGGKTSAVLEFFGKSHLFVLC